MLTCPVGIAKWIAGPVPSDLNRLPAMMRRKGVNTQHLYTWYEIPLTLNSIAAELLCSVAR